MKIIISGASGFVGGALRQKFSNHVIVPLSVSDFAKSDEDFAKFFEGADAVVNLAGAPIVARWSEEYKKILYSSRIDTTAKIVKAIGRMGQKPKVFISTSAVGIYTNSKIQSEENCEISNDFLGKLCQKWESEAKKVEDFGIRLVIFRFGIILGNNGGALQKMLLPFRLGLGGVIGSGKQPFSWVHLDDLISAFGFALENDNVRGVYNLTAPEPTTNEGLTKALKMALHRPAFLPIPELVLKLIYSEGAKVLTDGQTVVPERLLREGFNFTFSNIEHAIRDLV